MLSDSVTLSEHDSEGAFNYEVLTEEQKANMYKFVGDFEEAKARKSKKSQNIEVHCTCIEIKRAFTLEDITTFVISLFLKSRSEFWTALARVAHIPDLENVQTWVSSHPVSDGLPRRKSQIDPRNEEISRF